MQKLSMTNLILYWWVQQWHDAPGNAKQTNDKTNQPGALHLQYVDAERRTVPAKQKDYQNITMLLYKKSLQSA